MAGSRRLPRGKVAEQLIAWADKGSSYFSDWSLDHATIVNAERMYWLHLDEFRGFLHAPALALAVEGPGLLKMTEQAYSDLKAMEKADA